jgi:hypothetical protein
MPTNSNKKFLPPGYEEELRKNNPEIWVKRFLDVSFDVFEGQIFPEYDEKVHVRPADEFDLSPLWEYAPGFDFGVSAATACVYGCYDRKSDMLYVYDEDYCEDADIGPFAETMKKKGFNWSWADPSTQYKGVTKQTPAELYMTVGVTLIPAANDELTFYKALQQRIKGNRIILSDRCIKLNEQIKQAAWDPKVVSGDSAREKAKTGLKYPNHALDALKYMMSGLGLWGEVPDNSVSNKKTEDEDEDDEDSKYLLKAVKPRRCRR